MTSDTVIVTGIGSFLGYHVARRLAEAGYRVVGTYCAPLEAGDSLRRTRIAALAPVVADLVRLDITEAKNVSALIAAARPQLWIHQAGIGRNFAGEDYNLADANAVNLLPLDAIYAGLGEVNGAFIVTGSGMEYGAAASPHREHTACWPDSPYGLARLAVTLRSRQLAHRYRVPTRVARVYTVFGELDREDRLVTRLIHSLARGEAIGLAPGVARDICDIADVASGYVELAAEVMHGPLFDIFNLSRGAATPLDELARLAANALSAKASLLFYDLATRRAGEPLVLCGASDKALARLSWAPQPVEHGLSRLIAGMANAATSRQARRIAADIDA